MIELQIWKLTLTQMLNYHIKILDFVESNSKMIDVKKASKENTKY